MASFVRISALLWADLLAAFAMYIMMTYLTNVWNLSTTHAAGIINIWDGITAVLAIVFAYIVDSFLGDYYMLLLSSISYTIGLGLLSMSTPPVFGPCNEYKEKCIGQADECKNSFMEMKWKKVHRYIVFKIDEKSKLVTVDKVGGAGEGYSDLTASLPDDDCRYAVFDFDFVTVDNCRKSKIFFIAWAPSASKIRAKMLYATSKDGLRRVLDGIHYEVQATDPSEMGFDIIQDRAK